MWGGPLFEQKSKILCLTHAKKARTYTIRAVFLKWDFLHHHVPSLMFLSTEKPSNCGIAVLYWGTKVRHACASQGYDFTKYEAQASNEHKMLMFHSFYGKIAIDTYVFTRDPYCVCMKRDISCVYSDTVQGFRKARCCEASWGPKEGPTKSFPESPRRCPRYVYALRQDFFF